MANGAWGIGHWALGIGHWALGIGQRDKAITQEISQAYVKPGVSGSVVDSFKKN
ncbi:hypothetical protein G7B40_026670 [Aetokthonos hydrillicola Thurmond2011]|jgi:hypothetical protein|uniref:Uncharacterized protein n=1 Tax=Aetokthonos hydrillicola Thurmond2011 TaxID=2712845 RepID=A0AAP5ID59_9CYAN|nr:hypothetical protein [Aetokthonos hydrillicola]MBO3462045.1 hypothetical protein [Aetokthonos hydrillicola CCALA 1050]MBW4589348.1 hypothetical protein [Aetokthonos hydrillicola CCALA 1050]MDR9898119.1 hypothetical protein [Aetokthonos hydrillicola Thurmond2011]